MRTFFSPINTFPFRLNLARCLASLVLLTVFAAAPAPAATLTRAQAVAALFAPGSGVAIDTTETAVWSPYVDFGSGTGFEGLLPAASMVDPRQLGWPPFPGPGMIVATASYFFWLDDLPSALFQHPARFVLMDAAAPAPTVANGGIRVSAQGWWPKVRLPDTTTQEFFATSDARTSLQPPGIANPDGLIAGPGYEPPMPPMPPPAPGGEFSPAAQAPGNGCGLLIRGDADTMFGHDMELFARDSSGRYGVPDGRIVRANNGNAATSADLTAAITTLCMMQPPCDKIYVRMTSHGNIGSYELADGAISAAALCAEFKKLAAKGVPICMMINGCYTGSLLDPHNWDFPAGSVIITTAGTNTTAWGHRIKFTNDVDGCVTNTLYPHAFSKRLNDTNANPRRNDEQAARWVAQVMPCYTWNGNGKMYYPAGTTNAGATPNPNPQIRTVGTDPNYINLNVRNGTMAAKTDFHMIFKGDVRGGLARAWRSTAGDQIGVPWGAGATVTYDPVTDRTTVSWQDTGAPVAAGDFIHFGYCRAAGGLRPAMQFWTPTTVPTAPADKTPTKSQSFRWDPDGNTGVIRLIASSAANGGENLVVQGQVGFRVSPVPIPLENLNLADPMVMSLPLQILGSFVLQPDQPREFLVELPPSAHDPTATIIVQTQTFWPLNGNQTTELAQIPLTPSGPLVLRYERPSPNFLLLTWDNPAAILQQAQFITGPWSDMPGPSPFGVPLPPGNPAQFFQLVIPDAP